MMLKQMDEFLVRYREVETILNQLGYENGFRDLEEEHTKTNKDVEADFLRMCRRMRNFVVHVPGGAEFLEPPVGGKKQWQVLTYLDDMKKKYINQMDTVSKHLDKSPKAYCRLDESVGEALIKMAAGRKSYMLVVDGKKHAVDVIDIFEVSATQAKSRSIKLKTMLKNRKPRVLTCVSPDTLMCNVPGADVVFCTKNGDTSMPVTGIVRV